MLEERTPIDISDLLAEVKVPDMAGALSFFNQGTAEQEPRSVGCPSIPSAGRKDLFTTSHHRAAWDKDTEARCDFYPKTRLVHRSDCFFFALWQKSVMGRTLTDIKSDEAEIPHFAEEVSKLIREVLGNHLATADWCIVTTPKRRHLERNFATLVAADIASRLAIPFHEDMATCTSRHRVNAQFHLQHLPPQHNIILFDDFVTTGSTLKAMKAVLASAHRNVVMFTGINNKR